MADEHFWGTDMTTVHERRSWFGELSSRRKIIFCMLVLFVASWCFFVGFAVAGEIYEDEWFIASDLDMEEYAAEKLELTGTRTILVIGTDNRGDHQGSLTDTMMVVFLNMDEKEVQILSIPRDSYVQIPGSSTKTKINASYNLGGESGCKSTVEYLLGITIDNYIKIDFEGFKQVVDTLGGVEVYVDTRMEKYDENINLNPGWQVLNGEQALGFVRYRGYADADISRIEHQQTFIRALATQLKKTSTIWKAPMLVKIATNNIETDISALDAISLASHFLEMDLDDMHMRTVPGTPMWLNNGYQWLSYLIVNKSELVTMLESMIGGDFEFSPNVVGDEGQGRYSLPDDVDEPVDEDDPNALLPPDGEGGETGGEPVDPGTVVDPGTGSDPGTSVDPVPPSDGGQSQTGGGASINVDDIPEPGE